MIRVGTKEDLPQVLTLIRELAEYEKATDQVSNTVNQMLVDGFGNSPVFGFFVAEENNVIVGTAIYYWRYSTWKGKRLYLEDIIVTSAHRGKGVGKQLFQQLISFGKQEKANGMMWQVLDWNESAIEFYKKWDTNFDGEWINCNLNF